MVVFPAPAHLATPLSPSQVAVAAPFGSFLGHLPGKQAAFTGHLNGQNVNSGQYFSKES